MAFRIKTPDSTIRYLNVLYRQGNNITESAKLANVSVTTARRYVLRPKQLSKKDFPGRADYRNTLAQNRGFEDESDYLKRLAHRRRFRSENMALSRFVKDRLRILGRSEYWLAQQLGLTEKAVYNYTQGYSIPKRPNLESMFQLLQVEYKTLDDLLQAS
jgi:hypothetical protein